MRKAMIRLGALAPICFLFFLHTSAQQINNSHALKSDWWNINGLKPYQLPKAAQKMSTIKVVGNTFREENNQVIIFKGLSISDPDKLVKEGRWNKKHFEVIKSWGANVVRIPVHPISVHQRGLESYIAILDEAVDWCSELGLYVIIDWHSIGNLKTEVLANENYDTSIKETFNFWRTIAAHYKNIPAVAFYELFNEPTIYNGQYGQCTWGEWKLLMEELIDVIYAHDKRVIPLVAGFNWAYDLSPVKDNPIIREGIAYVTHPYPGKRQIPREPQWENDFGFVADKYPVIATEIGFMNETEDDNLRNDGAYGPSIMKYFDKKGISWTAWVFDPYWVPQMIKSWNYEPTESGKFFKDAMSGKAIYK
jgi:endoglucanase